MTQSFIHDTYKMQTDLLESHLKAIHMSQLSLYLLENPLCISDFTNELENCYLPQGFKVFVSHLHICSYWHFPFLSHPHELSLSLSFK